MKAKFLVPSILLSVGISATVICVGYNLDNNIVSNPIFTTIKSSRTIETPYVISDTEAEYIDFMTGFAVQDANAAVSNESLARFRNDTFWQEKMRYFGMDYFCDTSLAGNREGWTGKFVSREFNQKGNPYICFQMGGDKLTNRNKCVIEAKVNEEWEVIEEVYNDYFNDPLACQQLVFRVVTVDEQYRNSTLRATFVDNSPGDFGMLTFGAFTGACTLDSAAKLYNLYKLALTDVKLEGSTGNTENINNKKESDHIKNILSTKDEYSAVRTKADALGEVNNISDDFESEEGYPTFTEDYLFSDDNNGNRFHIFSNHFRTDLKVAAWASNMPFNQTGKYFLSPTMDGNGSATAEDDRGRFFSSPSF